MCIRIATYFLATLPLVTIADPIVLADFGGKPTEYANMRDTARKSQHPVAPPTLMRPSAFPAASTLMSVGVVENRKHDMNVTVPVFIAGVDSASLEWLRANQAYLKNINAKGIVTNIATEDQLKKLAAMLPTLSLNVVPVDPVADIYGLSHYPVLIDKEEIRQ